MAERGAVKSVPPAYQIASSLVEVFSATSTAAGAAILGALVPHQETPSHMISLVPEGEMDELCKFVNQFHSYIPISH